MSREPVKRVYEDNKSLQPQSTGSPAKDSQMCLILVCLPTPQSLIYTSEVLQLLGFICYHLKS